MVDNTTALLWRELGDTPEPPGPFESTLIAAAASLLGATVGLAFASAPVALVLALASALLVAGVLGLFHLAARNATTRKRAVAGIPDRVGSWPAWSLRAQGLAPQAQSYLRKRSDRATADLAMTLATSFDGDLDSLLERAGHRVAGSSTLSSKPKGKLAQARDAGTHPAVVADLVHHGLHGSESLQITSALLARTDLPLSLQEVLLAEAFSRRASHASVGAIIARNDTLDPSLVAKEFALHRAFATELAASVNLTPALTRILLSVTAGSRSAYAVARTLASNPHTAPSVLADMLTSPVTELEAARNPSTPVRALMRLNTWEVSAETLAHALAHDTEALASALEHRERGRIPRRLSHFTKTRADVQDVSTLRSARDHVNRAHQGVVEAARHLSDGDACEALAAARATRAHLLARLDLAASVTALGAPREATPSSESVVTEVTEGAHVLEQLAVSLSQLVQQEQSQSTTLERLEFEALRSEALAQLTARTPA